jgi:hypothetical protein
MVQSALAAKQGRSGDKTRYKIRCTNRKSPSGKLEPARRSTSGAASLSKSPRRKETRGYEQIETRNSTSDNQTQRQQTETGLLHQIKTSLED